MPDTPANSRSRSQESRDTSKANAAVIPFTRMLSGIPRPRKRCVMAAITGIASPTPVSPPASASATASLTKTESTLCLVNPSVFSSATSRVRLRTDIAIVFADTSMMANTTAPQMPRMNALMFPKEATNPN